MSIRKSGIDGSFKVGSTAATAVLGIKSWGADLNAEQPDVTGFDSGGWKQTVGGLKAWSGTATGSWDATASGGSGDILNLFGTSGKVELIISSAEKIAGDIVVTSFSVNNNVAGAPEITINFAGDGAPTFTVN